MYEYIFLIASLVVVYTYIGYLVLLYIKSILKPFKPVVSPYIGNVSVVIVARNEEASITEKIQNCLDLETSEIGVEVVLVSDGSDDDTVANATSIDDHRVSVINNKTKKGKSSCVNQGVMACENDLVLLTDVRQKLDSNVFFELTKYFSDDRVGVVSGELILESNPDGQAAGVGFYWRYEKLIRSLESRLGNVPGATGSIYMINKIYYTEISSNTLLDDVQIPLSYVEAGYKVLFENNARAYDKLSVDYNSEKRRKIRTLAGNFQLLNNNKHYLSPFHNPIWFEFFSHKVLRLIVPYCLIVAFISNMLIAPTSYIYFSLFVVQLLVYSYYVVNLYISFYRNNILYRSLEAVINLNIYAVMGLAYFVKNKDASGW